MSPLKGPPSEGAPPQPLEELPLSSSWVSRFIVGGTIGSVALPALVGIALAESPTAFPAAEGIFVALILLTYLCVARLPDLPDGGESGADGGGGDHHSARDVAKEGWRVRWAEAEAAEAE